MKKVVIIGAGPAGLIAAYKLGGKADVIVYDIGKPADQRRCPQRETGKCASCSLCGKTHGAGGAGLMSDGKLLLHPTVGNNLDEIIGRERNLALISEVGEFFSLYGINEVQEKTREVEELERRALQNEIDFVYPKQTHIGSDKLPGLIKKVQADLESRGVKFRYGIGIKSLNDMHYDFIILAPGRVGVGTSWMEDRLKDNSLEYTFRPVDIGVRVEVPHQIADPITDITRDMKFYIRTKCHDDAVRTFCTCPKGYVGRENYKFSRAEGDVEFGIVNGEASQGQEKHSGNTNFAVLVTIPLTEPLADPNKVARGVAESFNDLGAGKLIAQRFGDLEKGSRSKPKNQDRYILQPTLRDVTWGDISLALQGRYVDDVKEMVHRLNSVMPGVSSSQTILYGPEIKFHGLRIKTDEYLYAGRNIYVAGDGSGISRGIVGAMASGILAAEGILKKL